MISTQAIVAVTTMMSAFGHQNIQDTVALANNPNAATREVVCVAKHVWESGRTASFQRKMKLAADGVAEGKCFVVRAAFGEDELKIEFSHRRDAEAWDDAILATLTAMQAAGHVAGSGLVTPVAAIPEVDSTNARANVIARGNVLEFWLNTPIKGIDVEPDLELLQRASSAGE